MKKTNRGRPIILTVLLIEEIKGIYYKCLHEQTVANAIGVDHSTFRRWKRRGVAELRRIRSGQEPLQKEAIFVELCSALKKAIAESEIYNLSTIRAASESHWQAAAWLLERRWPHRWGRKDKAIDDEQINKAIESQLRKGIR